MHETSSKKELSEIFDTKASNPIHVNNMKNFLQGYEQKKRLSNYLDEKEEEMEEVKEEKEHESMDFPRKMQD